MKQIHWSHKDFFSGLLLVAFLCLSAQNVCGQSAKVNIKGKTMTLQGLISQIEKQTNYLFVLSKDDVNVKRQVTLTTKSRVVSDILDNTLPQVNLGYTFSNNYISLFEKKTVKQPAAAPADNGQYTVRGSVKDSRGEPIVGATVVDEATRRGTVTDLDGNFSIQADANSTLSVSYIGFLPYTMRVKGNANVNISLKEDTESLDEVVVIGYGTQKKKLVTGANLHVTGENIEKLNTVSVFGALQSQSPGVQITQNNGQPGEGYKVNIRGLGTTGNATPLYIIDGIAGGNLDDISPNDIESIDVLKDAASAAIYGARAANGVILVTTKQGRAGRISITYDGYMGWQSPRTNGVRPANATEYMDLINRALEIAGSQPYDFASLIPNEYQKIQSGQWNGTDWLDLSTDKSAPVMNHAINLNGGNDISKFSFGFSSLDQKGTIGKPAQPDYSRYTVRLNSDHALWKKDGRDIIKFGENVTFSYTNKKGLSNGGIYSNNIRMLLNVTPLLPAYNSEGDYFVYQDMVDDDWDFDTDQANPLARIAYTRKDRYTKGYRIQSNAFLEISPIKGLKYRTVGGWQYHHTEFRSYVPVYTLASKTSNSTDDVTQRQGYSTKWSWENTLNYVFHFDEFHFDALLGQSVEKWGYGNSVSAKNSNSIFPNSFKHAYIDNTQSISTTDTEISGAPNTEGSLASFFGRVNFDYNETYMLSAILRADGSSNFARGHRWGWFPSVSAGWVMTNEKFMEKTKSWLDFFKIRASWGQNGNCDIDGFQYLATISFDESAKFYYNDKNTGSTGAYPDIMPNEDVTWETSEQADLGFDARLLHSRLGINFDIYSKKTKDWLVVAPQLLSYGTGAPYINGGNVENKGWELSLNWNDRIGREFTYGATFSISRNKNKVTKLANSEGIIHGEEDLLAQNTTEMNRVQVGYPMGYFWGYKTAGIFQNQKQIDDWIAQGNPVLQSDPQPGDVIFVDTNGDGEITADDKTKIGDPNPHHILGFNLNCQWRGFDLAITGYGALGMQIAQCYRNFSNEPNMNYTNLDVTKYWTGEGSTNKYPRFTDGKHVNMAQISDVYVQDGDYVKISNITVGYDFKRLWPRMPMSRCRLYFTMENIITFTGYNGMDPEVGYGADNSWASGIDLGYYPNPKTYMVGLNIAF